MNTFTLGYNEAARVAQRASVNAGDRGKPALELGNDMTAEIMLALGLIERTAGKVAYWNDAKLPSCGKLRCVVIKALRDAADRLEDCNKKRET